MSDYFVYGGIDTRDYSDVYVFFDSVDTTPKRIYTEVAIPARNGSFFLDEKRYEDVEHVYHIIASLESGSDLLNALSSKQGYNRLEDTFHPSEFYNAVFTSSTTPKVSMDRNLCTFKVIFTRKPQRFLTSGETEVTVASGGTLTNPTLFDSSPLLAIEGYGDIVINGHTAVELNDATVGSIELVESGTSGKSYRGYYSGKFQLLNDGDTMTLNDFSVRMSLRFRQSGTTITNMTFTRTTASIPNYISTDMAYESAGTAIATIKFGEQSFTKQSADTEYIDSCRITATVRRSDSTTANYNYTFKLRVLNTGTASETAGKLMIEVFDDTSTNFQSSVAIAASSLIGESTQSVLGHPTYIDCDTGMAYKRSNGKIVSLNRYVDLGTDLPTLKAGSNSFFLQNTITSLKVTPRWWKV